MSVLLRNTKARTIFKTLSTIVFEPRCGYCLSVQPQQSTPETSYSSVMTSEVIKYLNPKNDNLIIDMTFGAGGHSKSLLENTENCKIIALDRDPLAHAEARKLALMYPNKVIPLLGKFSELPAMLKKHRIYQNTIDGIFFDLGCSPMQMNDAERGFSISTNGRLDMRMDGNHDLTQLTAYDVLARASEEQLYKIFKIYGEEKQAKKISQMVIEARYMFKKLETVQELADLVDSVCNEEVNSSTEKKHTNNAAKIHLALRIFVNNELNELNHGIHIANKYLKIGGRLVTISFSSLEDTIIKRHLTGNVVDDLANPLPLKFTDCSMFHSKDALKYVLSSDWQSLTKNVVVASFEEIEYNSRSKSAKLRAAIKIK